MNLPISAGHLGDDDDNGIQPNSQYDQSINFTDSGSDSGAPLDVGFGNANNFSGFSPRPDPNEPADFQQFSSIGNASAQNRPISGFNLQFDQDPDRYNPTASPFDRPGQMANYSPRPNLDVGVAPEPGVNSPELAQIFAMVSQFQPPEVDISPHFKPFLPDLVPSIGTIDAFIKILRPDGEQDPLGLTVLDEPTIGCSNPQILKMQLREKFGVVGGNEGDGYIGRIFDPQKNYKELQSFLESYDEIATNRAAPTMKYSYEMPDLEQLMEFWPDEMAKTLESLPLPTADLDLSLIEYAKVICAMLDIPVKGNIVESLHVLFSLFQSFKSNMYFKTETSGKTTPLRQTRGGVDTLDVT